MGPAQCHRSRDGGDQISLTHESPPKKLSMERRKLEAMAKRLSKKFGAEEIGASWFEALFEEFKKPYIQEVIEWKGFGLCNA